MAQKGYGEEQYEEEVESDFKLSISNDNVTVRFVGSLDGSIKILVAFANGQTEETELLLNTQGKIELRKPVDLDQTQNDPTIEETADVGKVSGKSAHKQLNDRGEKFLDQKMISFSQCNPSQENKLLETQNMKNYSKKNIGLPNNSGVDGGKDDAPQKLCGKVASEQINRPFETKAKYGQGSIGDNKIHIGPDRYNLMKIQNKTDYASVILQKTLGPERKKNNKIKDESSECIKDVQFSWQDMDVLNRLRRSLTRVEKPELFVPVYPNLSGLRRKRCKARIRQYIDYKNSDSEEDYP